MAKWLRDLVDFHDLRSLAGRLTVDESRRLIDLHQLVRTRAAAGEMRSWERVAVLSEADALTPKGKQSVTVVDANKDAILRG